MANTDLDFAFAVRVLHAAGQSNRTIMAERVLIERTRSIMYVGREHTLAQIIVNDNTWHTAEHCGSRFRKVRPRPAYWNGTRASELTFGCSRASVRTGACGDTSPPADRPSSDRSRNRPAHRRR